MWKRQLHHEGPKFPAPYEPHGVPIDCGGKRVRLSPEAEEVATQYARLAARRPDVVGTATFAKNFEADWKRVGGHAAIHDLKRCELEPFLNRVMEFKAKETKKAVEKNNKPSSSLGTAVLDGKSVKLKNYAVDMPGIFVGHGRSNPLNGRIKPRLGSEDVSLNMSADAPLARDARRRRRWKEVLSDPGLEWLARWPNPVVPGSYKYTYVADDTKWAAAKEAQKFDQARAMCRQLDRIRRINLKNMASKDAKTAQAAACVYLMDALLLRVGDKTNKSATGASSLRVSNVSCDEAIPVLDLSFVAKDQVRFEASIQVPDILWRRLREWSSGKRGRDYLFDGIDRTDVNKYIDERLQKGATAKTMRTCRASDTFESRLLHHSESADSRRCGSANVPMVHFLLAALETAKACNHVHASKKGAKNVRGIREAECYPRDKLDRILELRNTFSFATTLRKYVDPRIVMAFCARSELHPAKILSAASLRSFEWASNTAPSYRFSHLTRRS